MDEDAGLQALKHSDPSKAMRHPLGRNNWPFGGSTCASKRAAAIVGVIAKAKASRASPQDCLVYC